MSINEESARKVINFLLEEDIDDFNRWLPEIENFNYDQIVNLLKGEKDYLYPIKNKNAFNKLVMKFDNFEKLISKWYQKEENYKYLKQLWLKYICIEDIREFIKKDTNDIKLINFLEKNKINYSDWPKEVKEEFKNCVKRTIGSYIHEEDIKKALNEEHLLFSNVMKTMDETYENFKNGFKNVGEQVQKKFEQNYSSIMKSVVTGLLGLVAFKIQSTASERIDYKLTKKSLVNQIIKHVPYLKDAKTIAKDIIEQKINPDNGIINWGIGLFLDEDKKLIDGSTYLGISSENYQNKIISIDLTEKGNETISMGKKISAIFKSNMVCGLVAFGSLLNLGYSAIEFQQISDIIKTIAGKKYKNSLNGIKKSFEEHLKELDLNGDPKYYLSKISYIKGNIENDKKRLIDLISDIEADIKLLEKKKNDSILGLISSIVFGGVAAIGTFGACGIRSGIYALSTICNIVSGSLDVSNISKCNENLEELEKIRKDAELQKEIIEKKLNEINLKIKQKDFAFPQFYQEYEDVIQKENKYANDYLLKRNYF